MIKQSEIDIIRGKELFCNDLPSKPLAKLGKILITGASGYIGGRLIPELVARGYDVRLMVRGNIEAYQAIWPNLDIVEADALNVEQLRGALEGIDTAYYLIHSLHLGPQEFEAADITVAGNFRTVAQEQGIKRIIYLGGLGDKRIPLSSHLRNRIEVADELLMGKVPVTILRAAIIIGSGSASYEIILHLVTKLPLILIPRVSINKCQPIGIRDVIKYLVGVLEVPETCRHNFDIGGRDVLTYKRMLEILANIQNTKTAIILCPLFTIRFYAYLASLITPVPNAITQILMKGLKNEVVCLDNSIKDYIPFKPLSYAEAIINAMNREDQEKVYTRWSDAYPPDHELAIKLNELDKDVPYTTKYSLITRKTAFSLFTSICKIGGKEGWFHSNWMWRLRGALDKILLGVGTSRGRKSYFQLEINDVIDFWRVEDIKQNRRLLLRAEMKLPGKAWLEFNIKNGEDRRKLSVMAYYDTASYFGKAYWYILLPFHHFIFKKLIDAIERRS
ncbi:MAG: SDR family oxidoreductase [candidate division Zixibacteria bacterium]|nr:SDR family oxidoreductase [candidate division Zixibacteria bacterium]